MLAEASEGRGARALSALLLVAGAVPIVTGVFTVLTGAGGIPGENETSASVESELRFFAVFWIAYGATVIWTAPRAARETTLVRALMAVLFLGGIARAIAWAAEGHPHGLFIVLMAIELLLPPAIVLWQSRVTSGRAG
jgi:hypothetical protein